MITKIAYIMGDSPSKHLDTLHLFPSWAHKKQQFVDAHRRKADEHQTSKVRAVSTGAGLGGLLGATASPIMARLKALKGRSKYLRALAMMAPVAAGAGAGAITGELSRRKDNRAINNAQRIVNQRNNERFLLPKIVNTEARNRGMDAHKVNSDLVYKQQMAQRLKDYEGALMRQRYGYR